MELFCRSMLVAVAAAALTGCGYNEPPAFRLDMTQVVEKSIAPEQQQAIADILAAMFGTPDEPFALPETGLNQRMLRMAAGPVWSDELGGKHGLYRRHCAHCHGITGDGRGPTAAILDPYPRDYRDGVYKFKSTYRAAVPTDDDLRRIIHDGIPGTAMPSFALLPPDEIDALVEYVKYLSIRGQMETALIDYVFDEEPERPLNPAEDPQLRQILVEDLLAGVMELWEEAPDQVMMPEDEAIPPPDRSPEELAESIAKGRELFFSATKGNCMQCHGATGLGDGQQDDFDDWSKAAQEFIKSVEERVESPAQRKALIAAHTLPPRNAIPRNLREGVYRGGRRPIDVFWRVWAGIPGTPMPGVGAAMEGAPATLTQEEIWNIVDYVQSLPYEPVSRPTRRPLNVGVVAR